MGRRRQRGPEGSSISFENGVRAAPAPRVGPTPDGARPQPRRRAPSTRARTPGRALALALLLGACQGGSSDAATDTETTGISITASGPTGTGTTAGPVIPLCGGLDVSLVLDPDAPIYDEDSRAALIEHLDALTLETDARVRVLAKPGTEDMVITTCHDGAALVWGDAGVVADDAHDALHCLLDSAESYAGVDGYNLFGGLMSPILAAQGDDPWPAEDVVGLAMMMSEEDDISVGFTNNYNRPGMTAEAYIRRVGGGDRRRVEAFTFGTAADRLETFSVTLGDLSYHHDHGGQPGQLPQALATWTPRAIEACATHDEFPPVPNVPCQKLDILFVIDGSESMAEEQAALKGEGGGPAVFVEFAQALLSELNDVEDFHVGVVSTYPGENALHTHRDQPLTPPSPETDCGLPQGQRWLVGPSPTLVDDFACLASTRSEAVEYTAANASQALVNPQNAGFVRDDSLVFVIMLTDEDTTEEDPTRMETRATFLEAVGGDMDRLLLLLIGGDQGVYEMPKGECQGVYGTAKPASRLTSIVYSLRDRGVVHDICVGSLTEIFTQMLSTVVSICQPEV